MAIGKHSDNLVSVKVKAPGTAPLVEFELPLPRGSSMVPPENSLEFIDKDTVLFITVKEVKDESGSSSACWLTVASLSRKEARHICRVDPPSGHNHPGWRNKIAVGPTMVGYRELQGYRFIPLELIRKSLAEAD